MNSKRFSQKINIFHGRYTPEEGVLVGYGAIIEAYQLEVPLPKHLALISLKRRKYVTEQWKVFTPKYQPADNLYKQLTFALKYEGINLLLLKKLFQKIPQDEILDIIQLETLSQYSRRIWFLYEWLLDTKLNIPDLTKGNMVKLIDEKIQYAISDGKRSTRHRVINNLPGTKDFCPLIYKTTKLDAYISRNLSEQNGNYLNNFHKDLLRRASAFLLLKDSKASFTIEGESPKSKRAARWGRAIGQAGQNPLSKSELIRLQQLVIEDTRFINMGLRTEGGFIGEHDRFTGEPIPEHISAKWQDVEKLVEGLLSTNRLLVDSDYDAVLTAAIISFGFVFIHPFVDGNGRIHRYLIHHILARKKFSKQGIIFPVSASILEHIDDYREALENYSGALIDLIDWRPTSKNNVEVLNDTIDFYRYFDATRQAEFLYDCVNDTIENVIPYEISYLKKYDTFKMIIDDKFEMPDKLVANLVRFLEQNGGQLSKKAKTKEFKKLTEKEIQYIEKDYRNIFLEGE